MRSVDIAPRGVKGRRLSTVLAEQQLELKIRIGLNSGAIRAGGKRLILLETYL